MSPVNVNVESQTFPYPVQGDEGWSDAATDCIVAMSQAYLSHIGGAFYLTAECDFGPNFGVKTLYYKSQSPNPATSGTLRFARVDEVVFRNAANTANLPLGVNSSDQLTFNGIPVGGGSIAVVDSSTIDLTLTNSVLSAAVNAGSLDNSHLSTTANVARSKLAAGTASRVVVNDGTGALSDSATTSTQLGFLDATSSVQTQLNSISTVANAALPKSGGAMTGNLVLNADPSTALGAATKQYVDSAATGLHALTACVAATTANISLTGEQTIDGVGTSASRVLVKSQSSQPANGVYLTSAGAWTRTTDADTWQELIGALVFVTSGTLNANTQWVSQTSAGGTLGSSAVTFAQSGAGTSYTADGQGIELSGTQFGLELDGGTLSKSASGLRVSATAALSVSSVTATTGTFTTATISGSAPMITGVHGATVSGGAETTGPVFDFRGLRGGNVSRSGNTFFFDAPPQVTAGGGGGGTPGGSNTQVQFNDSGSFGGDAGLTYNKTTDTLTVGTINLDTIDTGLGSVDINTGSLTWDTGSLTWDTGSWTLDTGSVTWDSGSVGWTSSAAIAIQGIYSDQVSTTLGSAASTLTVSSIGAYDYLDVDMDLLLNNATGAEQIFITFNGSSTGYTYAIYEGSSFSTGTGSNAAITRSVTQAGNTRYKLQFRMTNKAASMKQWNGLGQAATDASTDMLNVFSIYGLWNNSAVRASSLTLSLSNSAKFQTGSQVIVRGAS